MKLVLVCAVSLSALLLPIAAMAADPAAAPASIEPKDSVSEKVPAAKPCLNSLIQSSITQQEDAAKKITKAIRNLDSAARNASDPKLMTQSIEETRQLLNSIKTSNEKASALMNAASKHVGKIHNKANSSVKKMIDEPDPDFDDVIWAF